MRSEGRHRRGRRHRDRLGVRQPPNLDARRLPDPAGRKGTRAGFSAKRGVPRAAPSLAWRACQASGVGISVPVRTFARPSPEGRLALGPKNSNRHQVSSGRWLRHGLIRFREPVVWPLAAIAAWLAGRCRSKGGGQSGLERLCNYVFVCMSPLRRSEQRRRGTGATSSRPGGEIHGTNEHKVSFLLSLTLQVASSAVGLAWGYLASLSRLGRLSRRLENPVGVGLHVVAG